MALIYYRSYGTYIDTSSRILSKNIGRLNPERTFEQVVTETIVVIALLRHANSGLLDATRILCVGPKVVVERTARFEGY